MQYVDKTTCRNGLHPMTLENTYVCPGGINKGVRRCHACLLARETRRSEAFKAARAAGNRARSKLHGGRYHLKLKYGMTPEDWEALYESQGGTCAFEGCDIRDGEAPGRWGRLEVDHDHETGHVRGLLCHPHNLLLGVANDNPTDLLDALTYLSRFR